MNTPALAALDPEGLTKTAIGSPDDRSAFTISLMERSSPPGVSSSISTREAPASSASSMLPTIYSPMTGFTMPWTFTIYTAPASVASSGGNNIFFGKEFCRC